MKFRYISQQQQLVRALSAAIGKTAVILPAAFVTELGLGLLTLGMIFFLREVYGVPPRMVGWIAATWQACYVTGCLTMRPAFESLRPRYLMIVSTAGMSVAVGGLLLIHSVGWTILFYGLFGFCLSFFWPPLMSWLCYGVEGRHLGRAMSRLTLTGSLGIIISPYLAGALSTLSPRYPLYAAFILFGANSLMLIGAALALPRIRADNEFSGNDNSVKSQDRSTFLRFPAWVGVFATFAVLGVTITVFPMYAHDELGLSKSAIGLLLLVRALTNASMYLLLGRTKFWHFRKAPMVIGLALLAVFVFILTHSSVPLIIGLSLAFLGPMTSIGFSSSFFHGASGAARRATRMAIHEALLASGLIAGSAVGGEVYQRFSMSAVGIFCIILVAVAILLQILLMQVLGKRAVPVADN